MPAYKVTMSTPSRVYVIALEAEGNKQAAQQAELTLARITTERMVLADLREVA